MLQHPDHSKSSTPFSSGDVLDFNPEKRSTHLGTRDEGLARQAVYDSFVNEKVLGYAEALARDLKVCGINIEAMRKELLGESMQTVQPVEFPSEPSVSPAHDTTRNPNEYHLPGSQEATERKVA